MSRTRKTDRAQGWDAGGALAARFAETARSDAYRAAYASVLAKVVGVVRPLTKLDNREFVEKMRALGGWTEIIKRTVDEVCANECEQDWGLFGKTKAVRETLLRDVSNLRIDANLKLQRE